MSSISGINTERLKLTPMTAEEFDSIIKSEEFSDIENFQTIANTVKAKPKQIKWYTNWRIVLKDSDTVVGGAGFAGLPNADYAATLHCGIAEQYLGNGYLAEAVNAMAEWAFSHDDCYLLNVPSGTEVDNEEFESLLAYDYRREIEENGEIIYRKDKPNSYLVLVFMAFGVLFGAGIGLLMFENMLLPLGYGLFIGFLVGFVLDLFDRSKRNATSAAKKKKFLEKKLQEEKAAQERAASEQEASE